MKKILFILGLTICYLTNFSQEAGTFADTRDGQVYRWVKIGNQVWMAENLAYLPAVSPPSSESYTEPYYYVYGYKDTSVSAAKATANYVTYGVLYNWPAAIQTCPSGWHLPNNAEWTELTDYLGGRRVAGGKLKEVGYDHWASPNRGADNSSGFTALPGGFRNVNGTFDYLGFHSYWWSATKLYVNAWLRCMNFNLPSVTLGSTAKEYGFSVRCIKD
jgi:uncharacterized protein (TIGR02145 family)